MCVWRCSTWVRTGFQLTCQAVTCHVMNQPHRVTWFQANRTQQELHSDKHNPTWHIHGKIGTKSFLKLSFRGTFICLQNAAEKTMKQCTGKGSNAVTELLKLLIHCTVRKKTYVYNNCGEYFCCIGFLQTSLFPKVALSGLQSFQVSDYFYL